MDTKGDKQRTRTSTQHSEKKPIRRQPAPEKRKLGQDVAGKRKDREAKRNAGHSHNGVRARRAGANAVVFTFWFKIYCAVSLGGKNGR